MLKILNNKLDTVFLNDPDPLNKVRAQFLVNALIISLTIIVLTLPVFYFSLPSSILFFRSIGIAILQCILVYIIVNTTKWKLAAHFVCLMVAFMIWSNIYVNVQGIKIISLQWMLLLIIMSYYLLGTKWGIFYSTISLLFMLFYFAIFGKDAMTTVKSVDANSFAFITVFSFNFLLIIYVQYHFFSAFNFTIKQLNEKRAEEKLLNEKLSEAIIIAEASTKAKSYFLSTISHELRTPLNGVIGMTDVLLLDNPREDQAENLGMLKFSANNLLTLINDVLDINKIESGKIRMEKTPFNIFQLVKNIYSGFKIKADEKNIQLDLKITEDLEKTAVIGDPTRLTQILVNLIDNALKFTAAGNVCIIVKPINNADNEIKMYFCISDTGIGIPLDKQDLIFESFSQASSSTTRMYGGTGLGLAIVKNLLELHHSKIVIKSEVGKGTSFEFEINYKLHNLEIDAQQTNDTKTKQMDISDLNILVAEDNQMNILLMRKLLAKWNIKPDFAANGAEAVDAFKVKNYDLILMDIHMPTMDGYEATSIIRGDADHIKSQIPIIALTASVALDVRNKITEAGINDFVSKPFNPEELRNKLEDIAVKKTA
ncbi:MAG: response regulator [Pedobacter sp.]|nr:MAG: response regulator [Pedobacter sp.]